MAKTEKSAIKDVSAADENVRRLTPASARDDSVAESQPEASQPHARARQSPAEEAATVDAPGPSRRSFPIRPVLFALLPVALVVGAYLYVTGGATMTTDNAYVQADMVGVANDVAGIVSSVAVKENQKVAVGDVLFTLDKKPFQLALDRANAQLGSTRNDLLAAQANYRNMQAQILQAQADIDYTSATFKRQQQLAANNFTPQASFDNARRDLQVAQQKLVSLQQQLAGIAASLNGAPSAAVDDYPKYKEMLAARDEAARQLDHTTVRAPIAGIATKVPSLQPGQYLAASTSAIAIVATDRLWVQASPKETELTYVRPGQKAVVEVDTYPGVQWTGTVESVSPASASSFSLLPAENTSGNWVKVVQRIPMRVRLDSAPDKPQLRMGMSVELSIETGHPRGVPVALKQLFGFGEAGA
ncbi:HlyD family secretion protein [Bradyrhizobium sp. LHD-71]|uniref:HlyD family secretion protein n=1 Tax=Bradyrhizobium sp. LHD-71 TaxID=3072141 RepID=UPI00280E32BD|nr:HlyD family secretion protein [Bradyrhizobium sp. LHD-71]MDQ8731741.1 HlyD family secretion protein [Bradyrhizobium sp. LHD-71]